MGNFRLNHAGFYEIRRAPKVVEVLEKYAQAIADKCNSEAGLVNGYRVSSQQGRKDPQGRWRTTVITATAEAIQDNARNNRLLRNLHAGNQ